MVRSFLLLFGILILGLFISPLIIKNMKNTYKERFSTIEAGNYPHVLDKPLLSDSYDLMDNPATSTHGASDIYVNYPVFPAGHCGTNNIRYWRRPTNGQCTPPELCMGLYKPTQQKMDKYSKIPEWDDYRVNFYQATY